MRTITPIEKVVSLRTLNRAYDSLELAASLLETARLLNPEIEPKRYNKIYDLAEQIKRRCPASDNWEF